MAEFIDIEENLRHFENISCQVNFIKPHNRRKIIKESNKLFTESFKKFKESINVDIEILQCLNDAISALHKIPNTFEHPSYKVLANERNRIRNELNDIFIEYFRIYYSISPPNHLFSTNLHIVTQLMLKENTTFAINSFDLLPIKTTRWNNPVKLYSYLLARKRYFYECQKYLSSIINHGHRWKWRVSDEIFRQLIVFLVQEKCINETETKQVARMIYGFYIPNFPPFRWLKSLKLLALFFFLSIENGLLAKESNYTGNTWENLLSSDLVTNANGLPISVSSMRGYFSKFREEFHSDIVTKRNSDEEKLIILINSLKLKNVVYN